MTDNTSAVDANLGVATDQAGVETTPKAPEVDIELLESVLQTAIETRDKAIQNAENWKKVGMARKNATVDETPVGLTDEDVEQRANLRAQEIIAQAATERARTAEATALKAIKEAREAKIALKNKAGVVTTASTSSSNATTTISASTEYGWTNDQIVAMKQRGINTTKDFLKKSWEKYQQSR